MANTIYEYECENCGSRFEYVYEVGKAPSGQELECEQCGHELCRVYSCRFELKGEGWPGKDIKASYQSGKHTGELSKMLDEHDDAEKEAKKVLAERRKGKKSFKEFSRHNKPVVERYRKNLKKGIKGNDDPKKTYTLHELQHEKSNS